MNRVMMQTKPWKAIAAMAENRVIGAGLKIPWHLPEDFKWFKFVTMGGTLVMGRRTYESIGRPLPGRTTLVLTRGQFERAGVMTVNSLGALRGRTLPQPVFICGGSDVYRQTLRECHELFLTRVKQMVSGDAFFPPFEHLFALKEVIRDTPQFSIERWLARWP